jgi:thiol-disulfide isomerase/thioredoxin
MKKYLILIFLICIRTFAQEDHNPLNSEIIKTVKPSMVTLNRIVDIDSTINKIDKSNSDLAAKYLQTHNDFKNFKYDNSKIIEIVKDVIAKDDDNFVKEYAIFRLFNTLTLRLYNEDTTFAEKCIDYLKPDNILFSLDYNAILIYAVTKTNLTLYTYLKKNKLTNDKSGKVSDADKVKIANLNHTTLTNTLNEFYKNNPAREVKAAAVIYILSSMEDEKLKDKYYEILKNDFSDLEETKSALIKYNPNSKVKVGNVVPYFNEKLIGKDEYISSNKLNGKYYLICFWATWCGNCIIEIKGLQDIYEKYKNKNFTILYVSLDDNDKLVEKFINERIKMPWYFVRLKNGIKDKMWKEFGNDESDGPPKNYLVSPDGLILENDYSWSADFENTISNYIK